MSAFSIEECVGRACAAMNFHPSVKDRLLAELARLRAVDSLLNAFVEDVNQIPVSVEPFTSMGIADPSYFERVGRFTVARIDQLKGEVTS